MRKGKRGQVIRAGGSFAQARHNALKGLAIGRGRKNLVVLKTLDPDAKEQHWFLVKPEDVPAQLLESEVMGNLEIGLLVQPSGSEWFYRAEPLMNYEKRLQRGYEQQVRVDGAA